MKEELVNYWIEKTEIFVDNDGQNNMIDANYERLMNHLIGHEFGEFLAQIGFTRQDSIKFLIDSLSYVNDQNNQFDT